MDDLHEVSDDYLGGSQGGDDDRNHIRRGWWDYVPSSEKPPSSAQGRRFGFPSVRGIIRNLWIFIRRPWMRSENFPDVVLARKCSIPGDVPLPQPARPSAVRISGNDHRENHRSRSPMPSLSIYRSGLIPRMVLCQEVMRNELCYTTFITTTCVILTILIVIGVNKTKILTVSNWLMLNWTIISLLAVHSFGRVVRRHEIEAMRQHPWSWNPNIPADIRNSEPFRQQPRPRRPWSPPHSITSHRRVRHNATGTSSYDHDRDVSGSETRLYQPSEGEDLQSVGFSTAQTSLHSHAPSINSSPKVPLHHDPSITRSPFSDDFHFPSSGTSSPIEMTAAHPEHIVFTSHDHEPVR